jgi:hypothetical protein
MPVLASKLIEKSKSLSLDEQEELTQQWKESISSMCKVNVLESAGKAFPSVSQLFQDSAQSASSMLKMNVQDLLGTSLQVVTQKIQESFKLSLSDLFKGCVSGICKASSGMSERYYGPTLIPPSFYPEERPPQIISMYTIYLSVSNIPVHFLFLLVKRTR